MKVKPRRNPGFARRAAAEFPAGFEQSRPRSTMNCAINTATAEQRFVRRIDNRIDIQAL